MLAPVLIEGRDGIAEKEDNEPPDDKNSTKSSYYQPEPTHEAPRPRPSRTHVVFPSRTHVVFERSSL